MKQAVSGVRFFAPFMLAAACCALLAVPAAAVAGAKAPKVNAEGIERFSKNPSGEHPFFACPPPTGNRMSCNGVVIPREAKPLVRKQRRELGLVDKGISPAFEGSGPEGGFSPADLRSAYNVPEAGGKGLTIAIVDAWGYPPAEADLNVYREHFGLPPCTTANGCFRKVNQKGEEANYPPKEAIFGWDLETALDLDMASATCPECKLLLVEANNANVANLGIAENKAAELGAIEISNSWGGEERPSETEEDSLYFNHPGISTFFSSGDDAYGPSELGAEYPTSSPNVISVGGTSLNKDSSSRGWHERAWSGAGSGCSIFEKKPEWQTDKGCSNRTTSDVSAVADPNTPVVVYESQGGLGWDPGWVLLGGTSASTPILAGIEARASEAERAKGAKLFWEQGPEGKLFDVTEGYNGTCGQSPYLCSGEGGYDGPTGWGTPGAIRPGPPVAGTGEASRISLVGATLNGVVNPNGGTGVTYHFEWGTTTEYGSEELVTLPPGGTSPLSVSLPLSGLTPNTTYHYRLWVKTAVGEKIKRAYGADHTFTTSNWSVEEPMETWDDSVEPQGEPMPGADVSCGSPTDCIAVSSHLVRYETTHFKETHEGQRYDYGESPLAEHWNGSEWTRLSPIVPHKIDRELVYSPFYEVSCTSATFCMLEGTDVDLAESGAGNFPLLERWNGKELSLAPAAMPSDLGVDKNGFHHFNLGSVSCTSSTFCLAPGSYQTTGGSSKQVTEVWNGTEWSIVANQKEEGAFLEERNLSCASSSWCMAIGNAPKEETSYVSVWNGSGWSTQGKIFGKMFGLSCTSSTSCMAVGTLVKGSQEEWTGVASRWNGSSWEKSGPGTGIYENVSCLGPNWCLAVGHYGGYEKGIQEEVAFGQAASIWNGSTWTLESSRLPLPPQNLRGAFDGLKGVSCNGGNCAAIGYSVDPTGGVAPDIQRLTLNPQKITAPVVSSATNVYEGVQESTTAGTWAGETGSFSYQWQRCNAEGKECSNIAGATSSTYTPAAADVGKTLVAKVTASGPGGIAPSEAVSKPTAQVQATGQASAYTLPTGSNPSGIVAGPDGKLWFTEPGTSKVGKITTSGTITEYALPAGSSPEGIASGPDGNLWFTDYGTSKVGKITTSGTITEYALPSESKPCGIASGPEGNLWYTNSKSSKVGKITTSGTITEYALPSGAYPCRITKGPDGNLWFVEVLREKIGKITPSGTVTEYSLPSKEETPMGIVAGPDGKVWFTVFNKNKIGKITTTGTITEFSLPAESNPEGISAGPDGNLWFVDYGNRDKVGRITTSGTITEYAPSTNVRLMREIVTGPDNRMWFTAQRGEGISLDRIGAIVP